MIRVSAAANIGTIGDWQALEFGLSESPLITRKSYTVVNGFSMKALMSILLAYGVAGPLQAQGPVRPTSTVPANSLQATSLIDALIKIATRFELPLAVEWVQSPDTLRPFQLDQRESASAMLEDVVSSHKGYSWQLENGVVHVFQGSMVNDPRNPLTVTVDKFPADAVTVPNADNPYLFETVREVVRPTGLPGDRWQPECLFGQN